MKTISLTDALSIIELLKLAKEDSIVLKAPDGEEFVLSYVNDFDYELSRQRQNQELMEFLDQRFQEKGGYTLEEVEQMLGLNEKDGKAQAVN